MTLPASGIAFAWYRLENGKPWREADRRSRSGYLALVLIFGATRLATVAGDPSVRVAMIASDHEMKYSRTTDEVRRPNS